MRIKLGDLVRVVQGRRTCSTHELARLLLELPETPIRKVEQTVAWSGPLAKEEDVQIGVRAW